MRERRWQGVVGVVTVVLVFASGCGGSTDQTGGGDGGEFAGRTLVVQSWGGALAEAETAAFYEPFEEATGADIEVVESSAQTLAILKKQVQSGDPDWDVITGFPAETIGQAVANDLLEPVDYSKVPGAENLAEGAKLEHAMGYDVETAVATYSTKEGVKPLTSMANFFDAENFPGPRMAPNWGTATMQCEMALLADGVPADELYPIDVERCLSVWDRIKPEMEVWFSSGSQSAQALVADEVTYCMCWDGRVQQAKEINPEWDYVFDGGLSYFDYMGIVKGSDDADLALALMEFVTGAQPQADYAAAIKYSPANPAAIELLPEDVQDVVAITPGNAKVIYRRPPEATNGVLEQDEAVERAWAEWISQ